MQGPMQREKSWRGPSHLMEGFSLPTTPSKTKLSGRRGFCSLTTLLVLFALVAGIAMFNQDMSSSRSRTETYYRKALVAKMYFGNNGQTVTATSEEYSRSTVAGGGAASSNVGGGSDDSDAADVQQRGALELADDSEVEFRPEQDDDEEEGDDGAEHSGKTNDLPPVHVSSKAGGSKGEDAAHLVTTTVTTGSDRPLTVTISTAGVVAQEGAASGAAASTSKQHADASDAAVAGTAAPTTPSAESSSSTDKTAMAAAASTSATSTATSSQGAAASVEAATAATAASVRPVVTAEDGQAEDAEDAQRGADGDEEEEEEDDGLHSEDIAAVGTEEEQWWSDVVDDKGTRLPRPAKKERDISASLASAVTFDESHVPELPDCKIAVLDVDKQWGKKIGAGTCNLHDPKVWPFSAPGKGIDGHDMLMPEEYQYSMEHWIAQAIRNSSRYTEDMSLADFVFVDMHCYHSAWMAWLHPLNAKGRDLVPNPEPFIRRAISRLQGMSRFRDTKGGDFAMVHPAPLMKGLFTEEAACEDLASVLNMVPERSGLCVWTQDSHAAGKSVLLPYAAVTDVDLEAPVVPPAERETFIFFQGGCGNPDPSVRAQFAAGKMLRHSLVTELQGMKQADIHAECACDICEGHMDHKQLMAKMSRSVFCPVLPSNTQSSRRLSEVMLAGCIPVFVGAPFHTLPLATDIDYKSFAVFINITDNSAWVNTSSPKWEHNHMIEKVWKLDDPASAGAIVSVPKLADLVRFLRGMPVEEVAARQAGVVANRLKFYYPPASAQAVAATSAAAAAAASAASIGASNGLLVSSSLLGQLPGGGDPQEQVEIAATLAARRAEAPPVAGTSVLGELLMRKMCRRAAAVQKRLEEAAQQGLDIADSDEKIEHPALAAAATEQQQQQQQQEGEEGGKGGPAAAAGKLEAQAAAAVGEGGGAEEQPARSGGGSSSAHKKSKKARSNKRHLMSPWS